MISGYLNNLLLLQFRLHLLYKSDKDDFRIFEEFIILALINVIFTIKFNKKKAIS